MSKVPKLRFPEFEGEWEEKELGEIFQRITTKNTENNQNILTISAQKGLVSQLDFFNKTVASKNLIGYYLIEKNDFAYNKSISAGYPMGAIKPLLDYDKGVVSTLYICFRIKYQNIVTFYAQYFDAGLLNTQLKKITQEGARSHGLLNISIKDFFEKINVLSPSTEEQQKIADCLSSLDELIEARREKIASLKAYKKGLLQQLFPQEVCNNYPPHPLIFSKLPKVRFAGFEEEWEEVKLGDVVEIIKGEQKNKLSLSNTGKYYVMNGGIAPSGYTNSYNTDKDTISISEGGNSCGYIQYNKEKFWSGGHCYTLHIHDNYKNKIDNFYLYQYLKAKEGYIMGLRVGSGLPNIQKITLQNVIVYFPSLTEQQKIADCLLSLDEKIAAETEQVAQLQQHKKGLLQQLLV
ncbi:restriction endonuclease subunit S [Capnocytophaga leadbetteri]|uniref:restriction endonuclease subunit S n=1 Tax=Capnocytophaga leadbetteri TaxID=327575 RepID=UPI0028E92F2C|nr:restriction endonuclease subunit S [Capnocytophaga leadbetteri]